MLIPYILTMVVITSVWLIYKNLSLFNMKISVNEHVDFNR